MQGVVRKIVSEDRFYQLVNQVKTNGKNWLTLDHGDGWTENLLVKTIKEGNKQ